MKSMAKEVILNLDFLDELTGRPTPEEEFAMEKCILDIKQTNDIDKVKEGSKRRPARNHLKNCMALIDKLICEMMA